MVTDWPTEVDTTAVELGEGDIEVVEVVNI